MNEQQLFALIRLDFRRFRRAVRSTVVILALGLAWLLVTHRATMENLFLVIVGLSLGPLMGIGFSGIRDRMEGTLGLLASLPVNASRLAALRLVSMAILVLPLALVDSVAIMAFLHSLGAPLTRFPAVWVSTWAAFALVAAWCTATAIAFPPNRASTVFTALILGTFASGKLLDRWFPTPESLFHGVIGRGGGARFPVVGASVAILLALGAWALTAHGIRNYAAEAGKPG